MAKNDLFKKDWVDIIFEGRNKEYGAYKLRLENSKTTVKAFFSGLTLFASLFVAPTVLSNYFDDDSGKIVRGEIISSCTMNFDKEIELKDLKVEEEIKPIMEEPKKTENSAPLSVNDTYKFTQIEVVESSKADIDIAKQDMFIDADPGKDNIKGSNEDGEILITENNGYTLGGTGETVIEEDKNKIFHITAVAAEPFEGMSSFNKNFISKFRMIEIPKSNKVQVILSFVVEKDGSLTDIKVLRDPGYGVGREAVRVLKSMPKWKPAKQDNREVRSQFTLPITVQIQN